MHARVIIIEDGETVSVPYLVLAKSRQRAVAQTKRRMPHLLTSLPG